MRTHARHGTEPPVLFLKSNRPQAPIETESPSAQHEVRPLRYAIDALDGISAETMKLHHDTLYAGYVRKRNEIEAKLDHVDRHQASPIYSEMRNLKREETFAANGQILHALYFENMGGGGRPGGEIVHKLEKDFGSLAAWEADFVASALCARGWVVLAYDPSDARLHNFLCDAQDQGGVWGATPLLACDTYEHAYVIDYGANRKAYVEAFMRNIDWDEVNRRFSQVVR